MIVEIADIPFEVICRYPENEAFFSEYRSDRAPLFSIQPSEADLLQVQAGFDRMGAGAAYPPVFLENNAVHELLARHMVDHNVLLMHGSALCMDNRAYIFTAPSGTGKSTHAKLWREVFGHRVWMINDDKPMLKISDHEVMVYGTPWNGKHHLGRNACAPLKAVVKLSRASDNHIEPLGKVDAFRVLISHSYSSDDPRCMLKVMELEKRLIDIAAFYRLSCNMDPEAATIAWEGMN